MLKIGTRGSKLARTQARHVRDAIQAQGYECELTIVSTPGDQSHDPVERIGVGVFTQALREAMARGECDIAVHSYKDLPTVPDSRFQMVIPRRADAREALIARDDYTLETLPNGATVGTGAPRRIAQLKAMRPDLNIVPLRGNVDSRIARVGIDLDAVILAAAGLQRIGLFQKASQLFDPHVFLPAPAQGALAVEANPNAAEAIQHLVCEEATWQTTAERVVLNRLEAGCTAPVAAYAIGTTLVAGVFALDGRTKLVDSFTGEDPVELGQRAAATLLDRGAAELLR
ncbi:hydroxymethylbilane synthase [Corynebacterium freiburgense]|uniref:hydroxymethylbilane synthase n=1 Tax=Corynebacterium freiburgense TaxID=556548 RepID=UPI00040C4021|nr:hydroxymethylbilane synthase [Corynebacterium freiburgense]WJZ01560.1 Porphobilinogen deaminase [Corynebacterium freiburgense]